MTIGVSVIQSRTIQSPTGHYVLKRFKLNLDTFASSPHIRFFDAAAADLDCIVSASIAGGSGASKRAVFYPSTHHRLTC